jgi:cyanate permease
VSGIALINSLGNLAGSAAPYVMGCLKDAAGGFGAGLPAVAATSFLSFILVLALGHDPALERSASPGERAAAGYSDRGGRPVRTT